MSNESAIPDVDLDFGSLSDEQFEMAQNGDLSFMEQEQEVEQEEESFNYEAETRPVEENLTEVQALERQLEQARQKAKGIGSAGQDIELGGAFNVSGALKQLSSEQAAQVLKAVNTAGDGSPVLHRVNSISELSDLMSPKEISSFDSSKEKRVRHQLHKMGVMKTIEKNKAVGSNLKDKRLRSSDNEDTRSGAQRQLHAMQNKPFQSARRGNHSEFFS